MGSKKLTYQYVKEYIELFGYKLLSTEYIGNKNKLVVKCKIGHIYKVNFANFSSGKRCPECSNLRSGNSQRLSIDYINNKIIGSGYKLLSTEYKNSKTKLQFMCPKGHMFYKAWGSFQSGQRCPECSFINFIKNINDKKISIDCIKNKIRIIAYGYELLSTKYINNNTKLKFKCPEGHKFSMSWSNFQRDQRCPKCGIKKRSGVNHYKWKNYTSEELQSFKYYKESIMNESNRIFGKFYYRINKNNLERSKYKYHLDHIYSIMDGFRNNIQPKVLCNPNNLQMMWWRDNISKQDKSEYTKQELYLGYYKHELEN